MDSLNPLVSIIIPVYNAAQYLPTCIENILSQTYKNIEVILVDDGSTDNSYEICLDYMKKYDYIFTFHKENGGTASARNYGVDRSKGDYIAFIDTDDEITEDYIEFLYDLLIKNDGDISLCGYQKYFGEVPPVITEKKGDINVFSAEAALEDLLYRRHFTSSPWGKLIKREVFFKGVFPEGMLYEDLAVVYKWFGESGRIVYSPHVRYFYLQRQGSSMHSQFDIKKWDRITITLEMCRYIEEHYPQLVPAMKSRLLITTLQVLREVPLSKKYVKYRKQLKKYLKDTRSTVLFDKKNGNKARIMALCAYLPYSLLKYMGLFMGWGIMKFKIAEKY